MRPVSKLFEQCNIWVDSCQGTERLVFLSGQEEYAAILVIHTGDKQELQECFARWKIKGNKSLFLVLARSQSALERAQALELGIDYYFCEPYSFTEMARTISNHYFTSKLKEKDNMRTSCFDIDFSARIAKCQESHLSLSKTEFDLLALFLRFRGKVLSRVQIWEELWGDGEYPLGNKVDVHIARLRAKLPTEARNLIRTVYGIGYRMHEGA